MAIIYDELEGSPSFVMDREGGSARRVIKVAWSDIGRAILEVFPGAAFGYPYTASVPGFKWLRASRMSIDPWNPDHPTGTGQAMNTYPGGAKIVVDYTPYKWPDRDASDGPQGANSDIQDVAFLEHKLTFGGEYLTFPNNGVRWSTDASGDVAYDPNSGKVDPTKADKLFKVFEDINVGVTIPTVEHSLTWNYVLFPPWFGIRNCLGKVNSTTHMNCAPETLLFTGATAERTYSTQGSPTWKVEYRISEKCLNYPLRLRYKLGNLTMTAAGTGYAAGDRLLVRGGSGKWATIIVNTVSAVNGAILTFSWGDRGAYFTIPTRPQAVATDTGFGRGASFTFNFSVKDTEPAQGWNHFLRPETGRFERMVRKDNTGIYRAVNFRQLYGGRV